MRTQLHLVEISLVQFDIIQFGINRHSVIPLWHLTQANVTVINHIYLVAAFAPSWYQGFGPSHGWEMCEIVRGQLVITIYSVVDTKRTTVIIMRGRQSITHHLIDFGILLYYTPPPIPVRVTSGSSAAKLTRAGPGWIRPLAATCTPTTLPSGRWTSTRHVDVV